MDSNFTSSPEDSPLQPLWTVNHAAVATTATTAATAATTPNPKQSPPAISLRAFILGSGFGACITLTVVLLLLLQHPLHPLHPFHPLWRAPFFLAVLSLFHFLEFYITARYNPPAATLSAFLLTGNGTAYHVAHTLAFLECVFRNYLAPRYYPDWILLQRASALVTAERGARAAWLILGLVMLVLGQGIRTLAMAHAGTNFNHLVQSRKREGHVLVTNGIYSWLRHPSYFGFFWWGLGTQLVLGNLVCLAGYAVVLWRFFSRRIETEEKLLVAFFGADYIHYRNKTPVGIPMIA
ncbi:MAG: hypothetical protein L6R40_002211 [Gallowayella cf. fulva]|nr:MAG: hypothetical protein L6R40_002211 [Xanthomendoza cf. fulva]